MDIILIILAMILFIIGYFISINIVKILAKKHIKITRKTFIIIEGIVMMLLSPILAIYILHAIIGPIQDNKIEIGKECCINMNGEIIEDKCKYEGMYMTQETKLLELGNENSMEYQIYCKKNQKLINKLKGIEE